MWLNFIHSAKVEIKAKQLSTYTSDWLWGNLKFGREFLVLVLCLLACWHNSRGILLAIIQEFQFPLWYAARLGTESEHQVLNGSHIFVSFTQVLLLFGTKFQYSRKRRQDEDAKQSSKAAIRDLVLTYCPTMRSVQQRKLKLLTLVLKAFLSLGHNSVSMGGYVFH